MEYLWHSLLLLLSAYLVDKSSCCNVSTTLVEEANEVLFPQSEYNTYGRDHVHDKVNPEWFFAMNGCQPFYSDSDDLLLISGSECKEIPVETNKDVDIREKVSIKWTRIDTIKSWAFSTWSKIKELEISENEYLTIIESDAFNGMSHLSKLIIERNHKLSSLEPDTFSNLKNLKELLISGNGFYTLSGITKSLSESSVPLLHKLDVSDNHFRSVLSSDFQTMNASSLTDLIIKGIEFDQIDEGAFKRFINLKKLTLGPSQPSTEFTRLLNGLRSYTSLTEIILNKMNSDQSKEILTKTIISSNYKRVVIRNSVIDNIDIRNYEIVDNLEHIELSHSYVDKFPIILFNSKIFPMVNKIILRYDGLTQIPNDMDETSVKLLDLSGNKLRTLNERSFYFAKQLEVLLLSDNGLETIPENAFSPNNELVVLSLDRNNFKESAHLFTKSIFAGLSELKVLDMSECKIKDFKHDDVFGNLIGLQTLSLRSNSIKHVNPNWFENMNCLSKLDLRENHFHSLNPMFFTNNTTIKDIGLTFNLYKIDDQFINWLMLQEAASAEFEGVKNCTDFQVVTETFNYVLDPSKNCHILISNGEDPLTDTSTETDISPLNNDTSSNESLDLIVILFKPSHVYNSLSSDDTWSIVRFIYVFLFYLIVFGLITVFLVKCIGLTMKRRKRKIPCLIFEDKPDYNGIENKGFNVPYEKMTDIKLGLETEKTLK